MFNFGAERIESLTEINTNANQAIVEMKVTRTFRR
jgi:hypothetical protein